MLHVATEMKHVPEIHEDQLLVIAVAWLETGWKRASNSTVSL
jgi:hypothetical protein